MLFLSIIFYYSAILATTSINACLLTAAADTGWPRWRVGSCWPRRRTAMTSRAVLTTPPNRDDKSGRADHAADEDTANVTTSTDSSDTSDRCEVCLLQPRSDVALVPCWHSRFCARLLVQTLSRPWTVDTQYAEHPYAWCCVFARDLCSSFKQCEQCSYSYSKNL